MSNQESLKQFFLPGDTVTVKQAIDNKPTMIVVKKVNKLIRKKNSNNEEDDYKSDYFQGILCRWFTTNNELQEAVWNTKDLIKI